MVVGGETSKSSASGSVPLNVEEILARRVAESPQEDSSSDESSCEEEVCNEVRGKRPGNRFWKNDRKRFSSVVATRGLRRSSTWEKKEKLRAELKHAKELTRNNKEARVQIKKQKRERRTENLKKREENARKSEVVQVIKSTAKLKRLKKKQLRSIEKRDTTKLIAK